MADIAAVLAERGADNGCAVNVNLADLITPTHSSAQRRSKSTRID